jgi:hypothetical protein
MKKFSEMNVAIEGGNGKMFDCEKVTLSSIVNLEIEVLDYTHGVTTGFGPGRYIVKFRHAGKEGKFFTTSKSIIAALDQIDESEYPFLTTIRGVKCTKGTAYQFT